MGKKFRINILSTNYKSFRKLIMTEFVTIIKKNGAVGVLAMWLWYTHNDVQELKIRLYECYGKSVVINKTQGQNKIDEINKTYAIIPSKIRRKYETIGTRNA